MRLTQYTLMQNCQGEFGQQDPWQGEKPGTFPNFLSLCALFSTGLNRKKSGNDYAFDVGAAELL
jgi:hypothetical protein